METVLDDPTSVEVGPILGGVHGDLDGRAVPAHVPKGLLTGFFDLAGCLYYGLHQLQVAATQLSL